MSGPKGDDRVAAIVVNWNGAAHLGACLQALLDQDRPRFEVLVVDNASTDGSRTLLEHHEAAGRIRVLWNATNRGYAGAVNDGLRATDARIVLASNFDVRPRPDYVRHSVAALLADPRRGSVQGKLLRTERAPDGRAVIDTTGHVAFRTRLFRNRGEGEPDDGSWERPGPVFGVSGALALYRREMLDDVALPLPDRPVPEVFDEDLFAFWEDVDLDWRAQLRGWIAWYEPAAVAEHERGGAGPRRTRRVEQLNFQNRLLTLLKCDTALFGDLAGFTLTTLLKAAELVLTVPGAMVDALGSIRLVPRMLRKRRLVHAGATVPGDLVVQRWFEPFDYGRWVRTWWRRVRGVPLGA